MIKYIPEFIYEKYEKNELSGSFRGFALFYDIKDFTRITEKLTRKGQKGAEVINRILKRSFSPVISVIEQRGGFVTGFAGDAFMSVFPDLDPDNLFDVYYTIQNNLRNAAPVTEIAKDYKVDARIVVSYGEISWQIFNNAIQNEYYFFGEAIEECNNLAGEKRDVLFSESAMAEIGNQRFIETDKGVIPKDGLKIFPKDNKLEYTYSGKTEKSFINSIFHDIKVENEIRDIANTFIDFNDIAEGKLNEVIEQVEIIADRYEAFFNKLDYSDKGLLGIVVFGAPRRREKTLDRVMYFALDLTEKIKNIKSGISSGRVYAGSTGSDYCFEYTILGYPPNLASRLMMKAAPGEILVDMFSEEMLSNRFEFTLLGKIAMKGFAHKLPVYKFLSEKRCTEVIARTPFKGREKEISAIINVLSQKGEKQLIYIFGEPGIGKSRLVDEVKKSINLSLYHWCYFLCDGILKKPYAPVIRFLKEYFQYDQRLDHEENESRFSDIWEMLSNEDEELLRIKSIIGQLLDFHWQGSVWELLPPEVREIQERNALISFVKKLSSEKPMIIHVEDGQWIDNDTQNFLLALIKDEDAINVTLLISNRYNPDGSKISYNFETDTALELELESLPAEKALEIACYQIKLEELPEKTKDFILRKAQGNPLFLEQISLYLQEQQYLDSEGNLQRDIEVVTAFGISDIIGARIDNLTDKIRQLVYYASVLGIEFNIQILSKMLMEELLEKAEVVVDNCIWNKLKELHYIFSQILFRDTAYSRMLEEKRKKLNLLAASSYEKLFSKAQLKDHYEMIALHYERGEDFENAFKNYTRAFFTAYRDTRLRKALELAQKAMNLAESLTYLNRRIANSCYCLGLAYHALGNYKESLRYNERAFALFEEDGAKAAIIIAILNNIGNAYSMLGDYENALDFHGKSLLLRMKELGDNHPEYAISMMHLGNIYMQTNRYDEALDHYHKALKILVSHSDEVPSKLILCYYNIGAFYYQIDEFPQALENLEKALPILEKINALEEPQAASIFRQMGTVYDGMDDYDNAVKYLEQAINIDEHIFGQHHPASANNYHYIGKVFLKFGHMPEAISNLKKAHEVYREFYGDDHPASADVFFQLGVYHEKSNDIETALEYFNKYQNYLQTKESDDDKNDIAGRIEKLKALIEK